MSMATATSGVTTRNPSELAAAVRQARKDGVPLIDYGIAHALLGHAPPVMHVKLTQQADPANGGIIEHYASDLTVRAAAGITLGDLQRSLKPTKQFVPIDADDDITLGEAIHHNTWGPLRVGYGSLRDLLLGLHYIDGEGNDIHAGGRTVKNVAGYDLTRFMVGSLGEMGVVHEATLRTYAIPEHVLSVELSMDDPAALDERGTDLLLSDAKPTHLSYRFHRDRAGVIDGRWTLHLAYFGKRSGCLVQLRSLETFLETLPGVHLLGTNDTTLEADSHERMTRGAWRRTAPAVVKIIVPPAMTGHVSAMLARWSQMNHRLHIDALPLHGCIFTGGDIDGAGAIDLDDAIRSTLATTGGLRIWHARPGGAAIIDPFGPPQPDHAVLVNLKRIMDPHGLLNPGRFLR